MAAAMVSVSPAALAEIGSKPAAPTGNIPTGPIPTGTVAADPAPTPRLDFASLPALLEPDARKLGLTRQQIADALVGVTPDPEVVALAAAQPEHLKSTGDYIGMLLTPERIATGRAMLAEHAAVLDTIETRFGVERAAVVAIWGVETRYGGGKGTRPVLRSLATLALTDTRRAPFWRRELAHAVRILVRGDIDRDRMLGSWAGAMGHTQFMPSTFNNLAVDLDGDGRRDIWSNPGDALASAANYLARHGWKTGEPWGLEVRLPEGFDLAQSAPDIWRPAAFWQMQGVRPASGAAWPPTADDVRLLLPAGAGGPVFLVGRNFQAVMRYNPSIKYALAVCLLADAVAARPPVVAPWPAERMLSRTDREQLQTLLVRHGLEVGGVDGIIGGLTRTAIRSYQKAVGMPQDGHPTMELLQRLRADTAQADISLP